LRVKGQGHRGGAYCGGPQQLVTEAADNLETGISVGGLVMKTIRYADDKAVMAHTASTPPPPRWTAFQQLTVDQLIE